MVNFEVNFVVHFVNDFLLPVPAVRGQGPAPSSQPKVKLAQEVNSQLLLVNQKPQHMIQLGSCVELRKLPTAMQVPTSKLAEEDDDEWSRPYNVIDLTDESCDDSDDINADIFYQIIDWDKSLTEAISSSSPKRKIEEEIDKDNTKKIRNKNHEI